MFVVKTPWGCHLGAETRHSLCRTPCVLYHKMHWLLWIRWSFFLMLSLFLRRILPSVFQTKILHACFTHTVHARRPILLINPRYTWRPNHEDYEIWSSLRFRPPARMEIYQRSVLEYSWAFPSLEVRDHVSHPYTVTGKNTRSAVT